MQTPSDLSPAEQRPLPKPWAAWCGVLVSFLVFSAVRSPVPGVNEPHYLSKAKHYWNPDWCPNDFFLESSNAHLVFYQTVGIFTRAFPLEQVAWMGRVLALGLLAWGWVRLIPRLAPGKWTSLWAAWIFLALAAVGNWSGEWMVGGVEAKVFSYGFGFWAMAAWLERRILWAALLAGLAVSFHPVTGGWMVIAAGAATLITSLFPTRTENSPPIPPREWGIALGIFVLACRPGVWPAVQLLGNGDPRQAQIATWIQVFYRLQHHLDPMTFSRASYAAYGLMAGIWLLARHRLGWGTAERWFAWFVGAAIGIALVGVALGYGERPVETPDQITWRYRLLKFYPFRLADLMLPMAASITLAGLAAQGLRDGLASLWGSSLGARLRCWSCFALLLLFSLLTPAVDRNPSRMPAEQLNDWRDACRWIREETPADTMVWTPSNSWAFKWHAERAEYVSRKDCPQDDAGIIEWNRRMLNNSLSDALRDEPRLGYAILQKGTLPIAPIYQNATYRIYDLSAFSRP